MGRRKVIPHLDKGVFLLSIDTELAWGGVHDGSFRRRTHLYRLTREAIARLLALQECYQIRATWAVVGHLFLEPCRPVDGVKHPEVVRPAYAWFSGDWFQYDPCTGLEADPFWYGPDIVEAVLRCKTPQEVGSHSFSHAIMGDPGCSREAFQSELRACQEAARPWGIQLRSFVFPRNSIGHLDALSASGYTAFRGLARPWHGRLPVLGEKALRGLQALSPLAPETSQPRLLDGLIDLPGTYFYLHREGWAKRVPIGARVHKAFLGLEKAARSREIFHLWFHPFNLATDPQGLLSGLEAIFRRVAVLREAGRLDNPTMGELAGKLSKAFGLRRG